MNKKVDAILDKVSEACDRDALYYEIFSRVREAVKKQEGKKLTKRLANAIKKELPDMTVHYAKDRVGYVRIYIWGKCIDYNGRISLFFGGSGFVDCAEFEHRNICYGKAAHNRCEVYADFLDNATRAVRIVNAYTAYKEAYQIFQDTLDAEGHSDISYLIGEVLEPSR